MGNELYSLPCSQAIMGDHNSSGYESDSSKVGAHNATSDEHDFSTNHKFDFVEWQILYPISVISHYSRLNILASQKQTT